AADHELGFAAVVGRFDDTAITFQERVGGAANAFVGVDDQYAAANEQWPRLDASARWLGFDRGHRLADFLNHLFDVASVSQNLLQALDDLGLVADVSLHDVNGVVEDIVHGQSDGAVNGLDARGGRTCLFGGEQFERVERHGDVTGKDLQELQIA